MADSTDVATVIIEAFTLAGTKLTQGTGKENAVKLMNILDDLSAVLNDHGRDDSDLILTEFVEELSDEFVEHWGIEALNASNPQP